MMKEGIRDSVAAWILVAGGFGGGAIGMLFGGAIVSLLEGGAPTLSISDMLAGGELPSGREISLVALAVFLGTLAGVLGANMLIGRWHRGSRTKPGE